MLTMLAQTTTETDTEAVAAAADGTARTIDLWAEAHHLFQTSVGIFSRGDTLAKPDQLIPELARLSEVWALVFLITGMVCLLNGYKFHKVVTIGIVIVLGAMLGYWMGIKIEAPPFVVAGCVGVLLAVMALPLMKYAIAVLGGLSGAFIGSNLWAGMMRVIEKSAEQATRTAKANGEEAAGLAVKVTEYLSADMFWVGALIGLVVCGIAAFALSKITIHLFTSVSGSTIAVFGAIALLLSIDSFSETVYSELTRSALVLPLLVFVPAAIGFVLQEKSSGQLGGWGDKAAAA